MSPGAALLLAAAAAAAAPAAHAQPGPDGSWICSDRGTFVSRNEVNGTVVRETVLEDPSRLEICLSSGTFHEGDVVVVHGRVATIREGTAVTSTIQGGGATVSVEQVEVARDGSFAYTTVADGTRWAQSGTYEIVAQYGDDRSRVSMTFEFVKRAEQTSVSDIFEVDAGASGTFDVRYSMTGGSVTDMWVDAEGLSLVASIDTDGERGSITLDFPRKYVDAVGADGADTAFIVMVDDAQVPHEEASTGDRRTVTAGFGPGASRVSVVGTLAVPEMGAAVLAMAAAAGGAAALSRALRPVL